MKLIYYLIEIIKWSFTSVCSLMCIYSLNDYIKTKEYVDIFMIVFFSLIGFIFYFLLNKISKKIKNRFSHSWKTHKDNKCNERSGDDKIEGAKIREKNAKKSGKLIYILCIFVVLFSIISICIPSEEKNKVDSESNKARTESTEKENKSEKAEGETQKKKKKKKTKEEVFVSELVSVKNVKKNAAKKAYSILTNDLGYKTVDVVEKNKENTTFGVNADDDFLRLVVNDNVYKIWSGDFTLYEDGKVKLTKKEMNNRDIGNNSSNYYVIAEEIILSCLKAPSTAEFCPIDDTSMQRNKEYVVVQGYVDSQNSFGAMIRSDFTVEFKVNDIKSFDYETIYINIDGESSGEYKDLN